MLGMEVVAQMRTLSILSTAGYGAAFDYQVNMGQFHEDDSLASTNLNLKSKT